MVDEDSAPHYVARSLKCWACEARDRAAHDAREANEGQPLFGWNWAVIRNGS